MGMAGARTKISEYLTQLALTRMDDVAAQAPDAQLFSEVARNVMLRTIDQYWVEHLELIDRLREGIGLRGYAQRDPLIEYKKEAFDLFTQLMNSINTQIAHTIFKVTITPGDAVPQQQQRPMQLSSAQQEAAAARVQIPFTPDKQVVNGIDLSSVGRNDECPCGSGKKFKKCYMANDPGCKLLHPAG
jgi:preprotein translocase subunit SecA